MTLCPCDGHTPPILQTIPPGLGHLPRQIAMFGQFRADLLARIRHDDRLRDWRARDTEDFGLMLLEFFAYVSDVTAFYTAEHSQDLYLQTARTDLPLRRLADLIGHVPRPAVATEALLGALLDGSDPITALAGAGFLSDAIDEAPPQAYELTTDTQLDPLRNAWTLVPPRDYTYRPEALLLEPGSRNIAEGGLFVMTSDAGERRALTVATLAPETGLDGANYLRMTVTDPSQLLAPPRDIRHIKLWSFTQTAPLAGASGNTITLSGIYPQIRVSELVVIEDTRLDNPLPPEVNSVSSTSTGLGTPIPYGTGTDTVPGPPVMTLTFASASAIPHARARLHFSRVRGGKLAAPALTRITGNHLLAGLALKDPAQPPDVAGSGEVLVKGTGDLGLRVAGDVDIDPDTGRGALLPAAGFTGGTTELLTPLKAHGNLLHVTRGKTVEEVLGSGQGAATPFQSFKLTKFPLTYLHDPGATGGRRSTLRLWIDGIEWAETPSLFTAGPDDRKFTVRLDPKGQATITTGGEGFGRPAPLGVKNVYALYRHGSGEPAPGANQIRQLNGPVKGLRRVFNVTPAYGGAPADLPGDIRFNAPATSATFYRAISANDFAALARDWGALGAVAVTEWVAEALREGVVVTAIFAGAPQPEDLDALKTHLAARAAETTPIRVVAATPVTGTLTLSYSTASDANPETVKTALTAAYSDTFTGLLSPRRAEIGGPVFRSAILGQAGKLPGIGALLSLNWNGVAMPNRLGLPPHGYFAPTLELTEVTA